MTDIKNTLFHDLSLTGQQLYTLFHYSELPTYREYMRQPVQMLTVDGIRNAVRKDADDFVMTTRGGDNEKMAKFLTDVFMIRPQEVRDALLLCSVPVLRV